MSILNLSLKIIDNQPICKNVNEQTLKNLKKYSVNFKHEEIKNSSDTGIIIFFNLIVQIYLHTLVVFRNYNFLSFYLKTNIIILLYLPAQNVFVYILPLLIFCF